MPRYLLFHKPYRVLSQFGPGNSPPASGEPRATLKDFIDVPGVYPAGRLDWDSEGLMLLTDDGGLQHRLTDPRFAHPRTYWVQVERVPDAIALERLRTGVRVRDYTTRPARARLLDPPPPVPPRHPPVRYRKQVPTSWLELELVEGRNRQVRRMTAAVGFPTLRLLRAALGPLTLDGLEPGQWRELTEVEVAALARSRSVSQGESPGAPKTSPAPPRRRSSPAKSARSRSGKNRRPRPRS